MSAGAAAWIGVGSNLDGPVGHVRAAVDALGRLPETDVVAASPLYGSAPMGPADQPNYVNAVVHLRTTLDPHALLDALQRLEAEAGRERAGERWGPRVLDLDLLLYGDRRIDDARLRVPHPGIGERIFVLRPLADMAPDLVVPGLGRVDELLGRVPEGGLWRLEEARGVNDDPFIVVEGPIGVGKTTLARRLADSFGAELVLEGADGNPFLERFYRNPREAALSTQLHFLLQRTAQMRELGQKDLFRGPRVADFLIDKDQLFAGINLDADEFALYQELYRHLVIEAPQPDLVIYLQAPVNTLLDRVDRRGIGYEQGMDPDYLQRLADAYMRFFHDYHRAPLLIVNASEVNFADSDADYAALLEEIRRVGSGRHFFNPAPLSTA